MRVPAADRGENKVRRRQSVRLLAMCARWGVLSAAMLAAECSAQMPGSVPPIGNQPPTAQAYGPLGDTSALAREASTWLSELIKINTTNPPGNEEAAAKYIAGVLQKEGIGSELLPMAPGRSALVARLNASAFADPS